MFSFWNFLYFSFRRKSIDLVLSSLKRMLILLSTDHSQMLVKSLFNYFSISVTSFPWKARQESSAYRNRFDLTAWGMSFTYMRNIKGCRILLWYPTCNIGRIWMTVFWIYSKQSIWNVWFEPTNSMIWETNGPQFFL